MLRFFIKSIDNDRTRLPGKYDANPISKVNISWINDGGDYEAVADDVGADYARGYNDE